MWTLMRTVREHIRNVVACSQSCFSFCKLCKLVASNTTLSSIAMTDAFVSTICEEGKVDTGMNKKETEYKCNIKFYLKCGV